MTKNLFPYFSLVRGNKRFYLALHLFNDLGACTKILFII